MRSLLALSFAALATSSASVASAFCGFYVAPDDGPLYADASRVALMREGTRTALSMSNDYKGPAKDFAMIVPVPVVLSKESVKVLPQTLFAKLETLTAPRLVEYWERDPCAAGSDIDNIGGRGFGSGLGYGGAHKRKESEGVKVEAQFEVGEYDIVILSASESDGLEKWLTSNGYAIPKGASAALAPYVKEGWKFFVAKVDVKKLSLDDKGAARLSPLRMVYESVDFRLPVRLGLLNASGKQDLIVYLFSKSSRFEVSNYPKATIPTNLDVADETRKAFGSFYATLFDKTLDKLGGKGVVTEYAWASNTCDPCPTPPLSDTDILTLGADILSPKPEPARRSRGANAMVVTRLHARYDAATLTEDLIFAQADPITGGRERIDRVSATPGVPGRLERGATVGAVNNFQGRYAIRHPWAGPIACDKPMRGIWGGPPDGSLPKATAGTGIEKVAREGVVLASLVKSDLSELGLPGPPPGDEPRGTSKAPASPSAVFAGSTPTPVASASNAIASSPATIVPPPKLDCCRPTPDQGLIGKGPATAVGLFVAALVTAISLGVARKKDGH